MQQGEKTTLLAKEPSQRTAVPLVRQVSDLAESTNKKNVNKHVERLLVTVGTDPKDRWTSSVVLAALIVAVFAPLFLGPLFVYFKLDAIVSWSWGIVLLPLWAFDAGWLYTTYAYTGIPPVDREDHFDDSEVDKAQVEDENAESADAIVESKPQNRLFNLFVVVMYILTHIFICLKLENVISWRWDALMTPYYVTAIMQANCFSFAHVAQVVLVASKLDGTLNWSWNAIFFPYWIGVGVATFVVPVGIYAATRFALNNASEDEESTPSPALPCLSAFGSFLLMLATFSPFILLMYKLNWGALATVYIFVPYFVVAGIVFVTLLVLGLLSLCGASSEEDNVV